jgi:hypothetical protein
MLNPELVKHAPMSNAVDVFKYKGKYKRDAESSEKIPVDGMNPSKFVHVCRFPADKLGAFFNERDADVMEADTIMSSRRPYIIAFKERSCLPGTSALHEPDFGCSARPAGHPGCYMKVKMDTESRFESGSRSSFKWTPPHYWGQKKLLPPEWAALVYPEKKSTTTA